MPTFNTCQVAVYKGSTGRHCRSLGKVRGKHKPCLCDARQGEYVQLTAGYNTGQDQADAASPLQGAVPTGYGDAGVDRSHRYEALKDRWRPHLNSSCVYTRLVSTNLAAK